MEGGERDLIKMGKGTAEDAAGKTVKKKRLSQALIDVILRMPFTPDPIIPEERLAKHSPEFREVYAQKRAMADRLIAYEAGIVQQYLANGYAEVVQHEVTGDDVMASPIN